MKLKEYLPKFTFHSVKYWWKITREMLRSKWNLALFLMLAICVVLDYTHESELTGLVTFVAFVVIAQRYVIAEFKMLQREKSVL